MTPEYIVELRHILVGNWMTVYGSMVRSPMYASLDYKTKPPCLRVSLFSIINLVSHCANTPQPINMPLGPGTSTPSTKPPFCYSKSPTISTLKEFCQDVEVAVSKVLPTNSPLFDKVSVLSITWSNDDLGSKPFEKRLLDIFSQKYKFATKSFVIPALVNEPTENLKEALREFIPADPKPDDLYILVYSGHVREFFNKSFDDLLLYGRKAPFSALSEDRFPSGPSIRWSQIAPCISTRTCGRYLHILDTCEAIPATKWSQFDSPEILSSGGTRQGSSKLENRLLQVLADSLEEELEPASVSQIYCKIVRKCEETQLIAKPIHVLEKGKPSIVLQRQQHLSFELRLLTDTSARRRALATMKYPNVRVLLSVNVAGDIPPMEPEHWQHWLETNMSAEELRSIVQLEGFYVSSCLVLMVSVPLEVWDCLPPDQGAYNFVTFMRCG